MNLPADMDPECIALCNAINRIPGLYTIESCCGHAKLHFAIWFKIRSPQFLPILLYHCDPCHVGFRWHCVVSTDCGMSPVTYMLRSEGNGSEAYQQAEEIARCVNEYLDLNPCIEAVVPV